MGIDGHRRGRAEHDVPADTATPHRADHVPDDEGVVLSRLLAALAAGEPVTLDGSLTAATRAQVGRLVSHLLPPLDQVPQPGTVLQAQRNAEARADLAREFGLLNAAEVAALARSSASNQSSTAARWRSARKIFSVTWGAAHLYPGFQLDEGRPLPVVSHVLREVGDRLQGWSLALWFTADSSWLDGARPVDLLRTSPADVVEAARAAVADPFG